MPDDRVTEHREAGSRVRVALVDDHRLFRAGVRTSLGDAVDVVGEAGTVAEAVALLEAEGVPVAPVRHPDEALLDPRVISRHEAVPVAHPAYEAVDDLRTAAEGSDNVLVPMKAALAARGTVGEVCNALRDVWGVYQPPNAF